MCGHFLHLLIDIVYHSDYRWMTWKAIAIKSQKYDRVDSCQFFFSMEYVNNEQTFGYCRWEVDPTGFWFAGDRDTHSPSIEYFETVHAEFTSIIYSSPSRCSRWIYPFRHRVVDFTGKANLTSWLFGENAPITLISFEIDQVWLNGQCHWPNTSMRCTKIKTKTQPNRMDRMNTAISWISSKMEKYSASSEPTVRTW